jgi:hypothetical protein
LNLVIVFFKPLSDRCEPRQASNILDIKVITGDQLMLAVIPAPERHWLLCTHMGIDQLIWPIHPCYERKHLAWIVRPYLQYLRDVELPLIVVAIKLEARRANVYEVVLPVVHTFN